MDGARNLRWKRERNAAGGLSKDLSRQLSRNFSALWHALEPAAYVQLGWRGERLARFLPAPNRNASLPFSYSPCDVYLETKFRREKSPQYAYAYSTLEVGGLTVVSGKKRSGQMGQVRTWPGGSFWAKYPQQAPTKQTRRSAVDALEESRARSML